MKKSQIGVAGLGHMGMGLSRHLARHGFAVSIYNRHVEGSEEQVAAKAIAAHEELHNVAGFDTLSPFVESLRIPRIILIMVTSGAPTQEMIDQLVPLLEPGDVLIDGGNSRYDDTTRRFHELASQGIRFLGCGISGGGEGVLQGPSLMPGGSYEGYQLASVFLERIAAKDLYGAPCCRYIGPEGAGHFVKMVHNGMEYAEMQILAEIYSLLRWAVGIPPDHIAEVMANWIKTEAASYLLDITVNILREKDEDGWVIDKILDSAGSKGTGGWAVQVASLLGIPAMMITAAIHARYLSGQRHIRVQLDDITRVENRKDADLSTTDLFNAYQLARIINYHEGFSMIRAASKYYNWEIELSQLSSLWTNGGTIRSALMNHFVVLWKEWNDELILHPFIKEVITTGWSGLRRINQVASSETIFIPCLTAASQFIAGASLRYPAANIIQAQRDYFGFHGFRRTDDDGDTIHHYPWNKF